MLRKDKLNAIEILISKSLVDSYFSHDEFVSVNNILREYNGMEKRSKKSWSFCGIYYIKPMETYCVSCKKYTKNENSNVRKTKKNTLMLPSNCPLCGKKIDFYKKERIPQFWLV